MLEIHDMTKWQKTVANAISEIARTNIDMDQKRRWATAVGKAAALIENRREFMEYLEESDELIVWSDSNEVYTVTEICECKAGSLGQPCKHRAAKKLFKNYFHKINGIVEVPLSQDQTALIDKEDAERVFEYKWTLFDRHDRKKSVKYARRSIWTKEKQTTIWLHRFILNAPTEMEVDHINGNGLDNRKCNLRLATRSQNAQNIPTTNKHGFRGIGKHHGGSKFYARIKNNGQQINIGTFETAEEAAKAYDEKAQEIFGDFAILNFPDNSVLESEIISDKSEMENSIYLRTKKDKPTERIGNIRI